MSVVTFKSDVGLNSCGSKLIRWYSGFKVLLSKKHDTDTEREWEFDVFDPSTLFFFNNSECSLDLEPEVGFDFSFAFNNRNFSDRILHIYVTSEPAVRVKTLHISSRVLAARSPFFHKVISQGQHDVTLQINASEEAAFMELLKFMYSNNLTVTTAPAVLDVTLAANKFGVASCMRHCSRLLRNLLMKPESVLLYLDLPSTVLESEAFQALTVAAKQFYVVHFKDMTKFKAEILRLPLAGVEAVIASDDLRVKSEDSVFRFVLEWVRAHYSNLRDRRAIIATRLAKFIRYPYMTHRFLRRLLTIKEFDRGFAKKVVAEAISFRSEVPHKQQHAYITIRDENSVRNHRFVERTYNHQPVKMVEFEWPHPHCVVYLNLKREVCAGLFPKGRVLSENFNFGGQRFCLQVYCKNDGFGILLGMRRPRSKSCSFEFEYLVAARSKPRGEFVSRYRTKTYTCKGRDAVGWDDYFKIPWAKFIEEDSVHFIDGVLHLKAELTRLSG